MNQKLAALAALSPRRRAGFAVIAGGVAALGLAPFDFWYLSLPAFAVLLSLIGGAASARATFRTAWLGGTAYFAVALHWIVEPFLVDIAVHGWMAPFALVLMAGGMALFWAVAGWIAARAAPVGFARVWAVSGLLVLTEYARATILTGFPWAHPGHALISSEWLIAAAWVGPHGLTALVMVMAAALVSAWLRWRMSVAAISLVPFIGLGLLPLTPNAPMPASDAPVIRLIQPNAPQHLKWLPEFIPVFFQRGLELTATPAGPLGAPDLVIWPETSLPVLLNESDAVRVRMANAANAPVIVGAQRLDGFRARNTLVVMTDTGEITEVYDKHHLVPFGEYLPFDDQVRRFGLAALADNLPGGFQPGDGPTVLDLGPLGRAFAMICYEAIFPGYIRDVPRPDWMVHITNDAWFGQFSGPFQHLAIARLRAVEQGLPVLRTANTGVSAVIDARGEVRAFLPLGEAGALDVQLPPPLPPTVYARMGDLPVLLAVLLVTGGTVLRARRRSALQLPD